MFNLLKRSKPRGKQVTLKISGLHCTSCSLNIDGELEDLAGVFSSHTSYAQSVTVIDYDPQKVDVATLKKTIEKIGYTIEERL